MFNQEQYNNLLQDIIQTYRQTYYNNNSKNLGQILNWSGEYFDKQILNSTPEMVGRSEIHGL